MLTIIYSLALLASTAFAIPSPAARPSPDGCTTSTMTATFDNLPTGTVNPRTDHDGLRYSGWEVVAAGDTVFRAHSGHKILRMTSNTATIRSAKKGQFYNDRGTPASPSFYFGCQNRTAADACGFDKQYDVPGQTTYGGYFNSTNYPHKLESAGGIETISTHLVTWTLNTGTGAAAPRDLHLYMDSYRYTLSNCQT